MSTVTRNLRKRKLIHTVYYYYKIKTSTCFIMLLVTGVNLSLTSKHVRIYYKHML